MTHQGKDYDTLPKNMIRQNPPPGNSKTEAGALMAQIGEPKQSRHHLMSEEEDHELVGRALRG